MGPAGVNATAAAPVERVFTQFSGLREKPSALVTVPLDSSSSASPPPLSQQQLYRQHRGKSSASAGRATSAAPTRRQVVGERSDVRRALSEGWRLAKSGVRRPERCVHVFSLLTSRHPELLIFNFPRKSHTKKFRLPLLRLLALTKEPRVFARARPCLRSPSVLRPCTDA